jgi:hypothetical protein
MFLEACRSREVVSMALPGARDAGMAVRQAGKEAGPWIERLARLGYAAKGLVYVLVGFLALRTALGRGGRIADSEGALRTLLNQPFGKVILYLVALGLIGYAVWRMVEAISDPEGKGSDAKGLIARASFFVRGAAHGVFALQAFRLASGGESGGNSEGNVSSSVMATPFGEWILIAAGLAVIGYALYQLYRAWAAKLGKQLRLTFATAPARRWIIGICRLGIASRGVVFALIGYFLVQAGLKHDPSRNAGLAGALRALDSGGISGWLFPVVAAGLIAYGVYEFIKARYRRITT